MRIRRLEINGRLYIGPHIEGAVYGARVMVRVEQPNATVPYWEFYFPDNVVVQAAGNITIQWEKE